MKSIVWILPVALLAALPACHNNDEAKTPDAVKHDVNKAGEKIKDGADKTGDDIKKAGDKIEDATDKK
jgi:predicted small secreted protein